MNKLVEVARLDIGKKEKKGNTGFEDPQLEKDMIAVGWANGWAWCACILEKWVWQAFPERKQEVKGLFVPSAVNTYKNLVGSGYDRTMIPEVGRLVFWQKMDDGKALWTGHCGIVSEVINETTFKSIEGNTNSAGSREGDSVQEKTRTVNLQVTDGLKVIGFIKI